ncbi:MAG: hypothetical protein ACKO9H_17395, partial [Planctomycetota bacterium]
GKVALTVRNPREWGLGGVLFRRLTVQTRLFVRLSVVTLNWKKGFVRVCPKGYNLEGVSATEWGQRAGSGS